MDGCLCGSGKCRGLVGNFLDIPLEVMQGYARLGVLPHHVWVTAHARDVVLENCPVCAGTMEAVPSQREKKSVEKRGTVAPPPEAAAAAAAAAAALAAAGVTKGAAATGEH